MPTFTSNDAQINYQTFGQATKPAIIFSNSLGTNYSMWQAQIDAFESDFYVICYDTRGHGESSAPQGPYSIEQLGLDVINLLDHLKVQKAVFCGISMGGLTGQWIAIHYPNRFHKVIICNTAAKIGQEAAWRDRAALVRDQGLAPIASTAAGRWFTENFVAQYPEVVVQLSKNLSKGSAEGYASCCEALAIADLRETINNITIPVLVIAGRQDPVTTIEDGQFMLNRIPNAEIFAINASHISNIEAALEFNQALRSFIN